MARQKREFTEEEINQIKSMYNEGKSILSIATQLHTSNTNINLIITKYELKRPTKQISSTSKQSKAALNKKREDIHKAMDELIKELDYCRCKQHNTIGMEQAQWKTKRAEIYKQIQALRKEGLATYINEDAENKLREVSNTEYTSVGDILKQVDITEARHLASKII